MTIERYVSHHGKITEVAPVIPGFSEKISPTATKGVLEYMNGSEDEVWVDVVDDDNVDITFRTVGQYGAILGTPRVTRLTKHEINEHGIKGDKTLLGREIGYRWKPSHLHLSPDQEKTIKELVADGTYTEQDAIEVRDQMLYQLEKDMDAQKSI